MINNKMITIKMLSKLKNKINIDISSNGVKHFRSVVNSIVVYGLYIYMYTNR